MRPWQVLELARRAPRLRCMLFNARGANDILTRGQLLPTLNTWGFTLNVEEHLRTSWTEESEAVIVAKRQKGIGKTTSREPRSIGRDEFR